MKTRIVVALALSVFLFSGCWSRDVMIVSHPEGAEVFLDGEALGPAPVEVSLWQGGFLMPWQTIYELRLEKPGYKTFDETISLAKQFWVGGTLGQWPETMNIQLKKP